MTFIAGLPEVDRDEATDDRQEDEMKDPITYRVNADRLIRMALEEDITSEDLSTNCVMPEYQKGEVQLICKQDGVISIKSSLPTVGSVNTLISPDAIDSASSKASGRGFRVDIPSKSTPPLR